MDDVSNGKEELKEVDMHVVHSSRLETGSDEKKRYYDYLSPRKAD